MNAQLNQILARQRAAELEHAGAQARLAREARTRGRKLRPRKLITRLRTRPARLLGSLIVPVMLAVLALSAPPATADPVGQITEFSTGLNPGAYPIGIAAGQDGDLWFADEDGAIGRIGSGAAPALAAIAGQTAPSYVPTAGDVGHQLACRATVTYPLPFSVTANATSGAITVQAAPPPPPTPALSALDITPRMFTLTGRRVGGRCQPSSRSDRGERSCIRRVAVIVRFTLNVGAMVTFSIERALPGQLTLGRCTRTHPKRPPAPPCTRLVMLRGTTVINGGAGADAFTFTGKIDGRVLVPGSYLLLATPTTDGIAGQQQQTTFEIRR
jgi:hypothetical protein